MEVSTVKNVADSIKRPRLDIVPGDIETANNKQMQQSQGLPENKENIAVSMEQINRVVEKANKSLAQHSTKLEFSIHDQTKEIMVKVLDADTGDVIKEIPSEKSLDRLAMVLEDIGWLIDKKV